MLFHINAIDISTVITLIRIIHLLINPISHRTVQTHKKIFFVLMYIKKFSNISIISQLLREKKMKPEKVYNTRFGYIYQPLFLVIVHLIYIDGFSGCIPILCFFPAMFFLIRLPVVDLWKKKKKKN